MRNALAHAGRSGRRVVSAFIATAFAQDDAEQARAQWRRVADQLRPKLPKLAALIDHAEPDVLAYMSFPAQHRVKLHSTNPLERLNGEIKRRTEVVGIFPNEAAITRLVGFVTLLNDEREKLRVISPQATAARQVSVAAARKPRCVDADVR
jgi:putative transposase